MYSCALYADTCTPVLRISEESAEVETLDPRVEVLA